MMSMSRFTIYEQWGHVGSEIGRAIGRQKIDDTTSAKNALERAINILDEMVEAQIHNHNIKEILIFRDLVAENYLQLSEIRVKLDQLEYYCNQFARMSRYKNRG